MTDEEVTITINGHRLTPAQSSIVTQALEFLALDLEERGRAGTRGQEMRARALRDIDGVRAAIYRK